MSYIEETMANGEQLVKRVEFNWTAYVSIWLWAILGLVIIIGPIVALVKWLQLKKTEYGITNRRVVAKTGVLSLTTDEMRHSAIETVEVSQSFWERLFGAGTVKVTGRGNSDVLFKGIDEPLAIKREIENASQEAAE
ncbi:MAG: PH domain-containing protein [Cellvibrionaceae bacterium]